MDEMRTHFDTKANKVGNKNKLTTPFVFVDTAALQYADGIIRWKPRRSASREKPRRLG